MTSRERLLAVANDSRDASYAIKQRKMFMYRDAFGLTNQDLRDLAEILLRRDVTSLKDLEEDQLVRMLDALEGATLVTALING